MLGKKKHAGWVFVYGLILSVAGLFAVEMSLPLSDSMHRAVEMLIVMVAYTLYLLWEQKNNRALQLDEQQRIQEIARLAIGPLQVKPASQPEKILVNERHSLSTFRLITLPIVSLGTLVSTFIQDLLR